ncbi:Dynein heavy chain 7, axonemal [Cladochytrium tenue]|nr:Dynein heavy chain 7, axonemal [Cladochytrium tenue]
MEKDNNLQVLKLTDPDYVRNLENAIIFGAPVLLENDKEELDPILDTVLQKKTFKSGGSTCIRLGDAVIEYADSFRLYITTKLRNYLPELSVKVSLLNFMITPEGLEDQLLRIVVAKERPELEEEKIQLILHNILENETAIKVLSSSNILSVELFEKQKVAEETERKIDETRDSYRPIARRVVLFFCIACLVNVESMYQYSLNWVPKRRLKNLEAYFTYSLYCNICRSLFEKDKLLFSLLLCACVLRSRAELDPQDFSFFTFGAVGVAAAVDPNPNPDPSVFSDKIWAELGHLFAPPAVRAFRIDLNPLERRCPAAAVQECVKTKLGPKFIEPPTFDLAASLEDSSSRTPLIFILSPGVDHMAQLLKFADDKGFGGQKCQSISLGQGRGPIAAAIIKEAQKAGCWVVLHDCHLAVSWLQALEKIVDDMAAASASVHKDFRLRLTSYPSDRFPASILQHGVKMTNEPPNGIKATLLKNFVSDRVANVKFFGGCSKPLEWEKLLFGLCMFHAVVQIGRIIWHSFPFRNIVRQLQMFMDEYAEIPFKALVYLTGECNYGGRVTDDWDRRTLMNILSTFYCPAVEKYQDYLAYIKQLPLNQEPEVFGVHDNSDIAKQFADTKNMLGSIQKTQEQSAAGGGGGGGTKSSDEIVVEVATYMLARIPSTFSIEAAAQRYPVNYNESMNTVLIQEMIRFNRLIQVILTSLIKCRKLSAA